MRRKHFILATFYLSATIQFVWCYLWLTRPYVNTALYSRGAERMPFQGRCLMMPVMRWAHGSRALQWLAEPFGLYRFWFPKPVAPEVIAQAVIDVLCLIAAGWFTIRIYEASSRRKLLTPFVYPVFLVVCGATYVMHTVQNFRFIYDLPSLAFFSAAMYLLYFHKHWILFVGLFLVATVNRETTLLLLPLYVINETFDGTGIQWTRLLRLRPLLLVSSLTIIWIAWEILMRSLFQGNGSEFYPRFSWNVKSLLAPLAWPQLFSACGYLLLGVVLLRDRIPDGRLRAWLWLVPIWLVFMFSFGILIETRVFGELTAFVVCSACLIAEETIALRLQQPSPTAALSLAQRSSRTVPAVGLRATPVTMFSAQDRSAAGLFRVAGPNSGDAKNIT